MSVDDILTMDDRDLNRKVSLKKLAPYRDPNAPKWQLPTRDFRPRHPPVKRQRMDRAAPPPKPQSAPIDPSTALTAAAKRRLRKKQLSQRLASESSQA